MRLTENFEKSVIGNAVKFECQHLSALLSSMSESEIERNINDLGCDAVKFVA